MTINERIRQLRSILKLSQVEMADQIHVSHGHIANIENGRREVNERTLSLISLTFGVSKAWLETGEGSMFDVSAEGKLDRIAGLFNELNPHFQNFVIKQLEELLATQKDIDEESKGKEGNKEKV
jgi:transcriptional regulator with XRE-family HTH domain